MFRSFLNPFGFIVLRYLPVVNREENESPADFAERVRTAIANSAGLIKTDYNNDDMHYFLGYKPKEAASEAYLRDFGKLGQLKDIREKKKNKNYELI